MFLDTHDDSELSGDEYEEDDKKEDTDGELKLQDSEILKKIPSKNRRRGKNASFVYSESSIAVVILYICIET